MDQENLSYTTVAIKSSLDKNFLSDLQSKTNLVENRLNNNAKVLKEIRDRISETYSLHEKSQKNNKKINAELSSMKKKYKELSDKYNAICTAIK